MWHWPSLNVHFTCSQPKAVWTGLTPSPACPRCTKGRHRCCFNSSHRFCWQLLHPSQHWQKGTRTPACQGKTRQALYLRYCWTFISKMLDWESKPLRLAARFLLPSPSQKLCTSSHSTAHQIPFKGLQISVRSKHHKAKNITEQKKKLFLMEVFKR